MESLSCPCRAYGCSFCHQFLSDVGLSVIPSMCSGICVSALFQSVQKLLGSSLPGDGSELPVCEA